MMVSGVSLQHPSAMSTFGWICALYKSSYFTLFLFFFYADNCVR
jgi:hypothetical protein